MPQTSTRGSFRAIVTGDHREGKCEKCGTLTAKELYTEGTRQRVRVICPNCGGSGRLIARSVSVRPPNPPQCLSIRCLYKFFKDTLFCALLSNYHARRVHYAERNRNKVILERYRTGKPSPKNIWQAVHAIVKLKCPICRKYNVDPLLFGGNHNGTD